MPPSRPPPPLDPEIEQLIADERARLQRAAKAAKATQQAAWNLATQPADERAFRRATQPASAAAPPSLIGAPPRKPST